MRAVLFLVLFASCSHLSGQFKDCARQVAENRLLLTVGDALNCDGDEQCLKDKAKADAMYLAIDLEQCAPAQVKDGSQ